MMNFNSYDIYLIGDKKFFKNDDEYLSALDESFSNGVKAFQLRQKDITASDFVKIGKNIKNNILKKYPEVKFFINDRVDAALSISADGVHLNINSIPIKTVKKKFKNLKIFYSSHSLEEAVKAEKDGADFITFSPVYKTEKQDFFYGADVLKKVVDTLRIPVYALGGINASNISEVKQTGCRYIAVQSAILSKKNIGKEVKNLLNILNK